MNFFYFIADFIAPAAMLLVGIWWRLSPPAYGKHGLAYSTELTRENPDAWIAAHRHCGKLWVRIGLISALVSGILIALFPEHHADFWMWLIVGQMVLFCVSVFMVDLLLETQFGEDQRKP